MGNKIHSVGKQTAPASKNNAAISPSSVGIHPFPPAPVDKPKAKADEVFMRRKNYWQRDIIINKSGVWHNAVQVTKVLPLHGKPQEHVDKTVVQENFLKTWAEMSDAAKEAYFTEDKNFVEIQVALGDATANSILTIMADLPDNLVEKVKNLTVTLRFPDAGGEKTSSAAQGFDEAHPFLDSTDFIAEKLEQYSSRESYALLTRLAFQINRFKSLGRAEVLLTPTTAWTKPITKNHLHCLLPFYDLAYTNWVARFRSAYQEKPLTIRGWPMTYLASQRNRVLEKRGKESKAYHEQTFSKGSEHPVPFDL